MRLPFLRTVAAGLALVSWCAVAGEPARPGAVQTAQAVKSEPPPPGKSPAYDAAFQAMQSDPGNSDKALRFAEIAATIGDYEGAIGALERVLIFNPGLATVRAQLGIIYYRLGAQARAQEYLSRALESDLSGPLASQARETLKLSQSALSDHTVTGSIGLGIRGQTNVNAGPNNGITRIIGTDFALPPLLRRRHDANLAGLGNITHVYNPHRVDGATWESNAFAYGAKQFSVEELDTALVSGDTGPRFFVPAISESFSLRPYFRMDHAAVGGANFFTAYGGGISFTAPITDKFTLAGGVETQHFEYYTDDTKPRLDDKSGPAVSFTLTPFYTITENQAAALVFRGTRILANAGYETAWRFAMSPNYYVQFDPGLTAMPWRANAFFAHVRTDYAEADFLVDPSRRRSDREWDLGGSLTIPFSKSWATVIQVQQQWVDSSLPNFRYDNFSGQVLVVWSF